MVSKSFGVLINHSQVVSTFFSSLFFQETLIISEPSTQGSPEGLEFFEMRRRNLPGVEEEGYGPFGVLIPIVDAEGASLFRCVEQGD
jgi:hypothetical protein